MPSSTFILIRVPDTTYHKRSSTPYDLYQEMTSIFILCYIFRRSPRCLQRAQRSTQRWWWRSWMRFCKHEARRAQTGNAGSTLDQDVKLCWVDRQWGTHLIGKELKLFTQFSKAVHTNFPPRGRSRQSPKQGFPLPCRIAGLQISLNGESIYAMY